MRDVFAEMLEQGLDAVQEDLRARPDTDPWYDFGDEDLQVRGPPVFECCVGSV